MSNPKCLDLTYVIPLTLALSAGLAFMDHLCHSQPLIEVRAQPSDLGQGVNFLDFFVLVSFASACLDVACLVSFTSVCLDAACLTDPFSTFKSFFKRDDGKPSTRSFLFIFDPLIAAERVTQDGNINHDDTVK